ncbi:hypothetical protein ACP70R_008530 [Stipagrostis hirtigluma subsp. patula]
MASKFSSAFCMIIFFAVIVTIALLSHTGVADDGGKYGQCFTHPTCSNFCKNQGYIKGGDMVPANSDDCCCII